MTVYCYRPRHPNASENGYVTKQEALEWDYYNNPDNRAIIGNQVVSFNFISDHMDPTRHMCDGKMYDSKAAFRQTTKANGCIEVGNDTSHLNTPRKQIQLDRRERRNHIKKAIYDLKNGKTT